MSQIYVNYGSFSGWSEKIRRRNTELLNNLKEIKNLIHSLSGEWESDSATAIREKIAGMEPRFQQYYDVVENYAIFLTNTANEYMGTERTNTSNANRFI